MQRAARATAAVSVRRREARTVTEPRRPATDMRVVLEALGKINDRLDEVVDHTRRSDARLDETVKRSAVADASLDRLKDDHERGQLRLDNRTAEILETQTRAYREFEAGLRGVREKVAVLEETVNAHKAEDIKAASEGGAQGAAKGAAESVSTSQTRTVGIISFVTASAVLIGNADKIWGAFLRLLHISVSGDDPGQP